MGNAGSSLSSTRRLEARQSQSQAGNLAITHDHAASSSTVRQRDTSSSHEPRKRNRFSTLRNPFRSSNTAVVRNSGSQERRRHRAGNTANRSMRGQVMDTSAGASGDETHNESCSPMNFASSMQQNVRASGSVSDRQSSTNNALESQADQEPEIASALRQEVDREHIHAPSVDSPGTIGHDMEDASAVEHREASSLFSNYLDASSEVGTSPPLIRDTPEAITASEDTASENTPSTATNSQNDLPNTEHNRTLSGLPADDQAAMLARLLSAAAAATAASLISSDQEAALNDAREVSVQSTDTQASSDGSAASSDYVDGSFNSFLNALQNGRLAEALRGGNNRSSTSFGTQEPVNFFRMFRFNTTTSNTQQESIEQAPSVRMVPIIIVGIRSVQPGDSHENGNPLPSIFGGMQATNDNGRSEIDSTSRPTTANSGPEEPLVTSRSPILTASETAATSQDSHANDVGMASRLDPSIETATLSDAGHRRNTEVPEEPEVPSTNSTQTNPTIMDTVLERLRSLRPESSSTTIGRRRSRRPMWRPFSTADTRELHTDAPEANPARPNLAVFLVYVLGGTYPENHPILTTPSLFTDTPSYEDMLMLTSLIGPANPQTADRQDLDSAGLSYDLPEGADELSSRCQVCLSNYEVGNSCRRLATCGHLFHTECIDEWLTTGRNNCPMCRANTAARVKPPATATANPSTAGPMEADAAPQPIGETSAAET